MAEVCVKALKYSAFFLSLMVLAVILYETYRVQLAQSRTPFVKSIYLETHSQSGFSDAQIDALLKIEDPNFF